VNAELETQRLNQGAGLRILTETVTSPTLGYQIGELLRRFPKAKWHQYEPRTRPAQEGARLALANWSRLIIDRQLMLFCRLTPILAWPPTFATRATSPIRAPMGKPTDELALYGGFHAHRNWLHGRPQAALSSANRALHQSCRKGSGSNIPETVPVGYENGRDSSHLQRHRVAHCYRGDQQPPTSRVGSRQNQRLGTSNDRYLPDPIETSPPIRPSHPGSRKDMDANLVQLLIIIGGNRLTARRSKSRQPPRQIQPHVHLSLYEDELRRYVTGNSRGALRQNLSDARL
jgi:molybdopterin-containing oxidoreductase family iron-sulfur binding subunit